MKRRTYKATWLRLLAVPAIITLVSLSVIVGYASNALTPSRARQSVGYRPPDPANWYGSPAARTAVTDASGVDPLADYKEALSLLRNDYYGVVIGPSETRKLTYEAIRGMLGSLRDQFTSFLDPDEWSQFRATTQGDFEGIGAILDPAGLYVKVSRPIETGPAERAGIQSNDLILRVNHETMRGKDINYVVRRIKGPRGTRVTIDVLRQTKVLSFAITRALVEPPVVEHWMEDADAKIGHIVLKEFNEKSIDQLLRAYRDLDRQGMKSLILDLRNNPGGLLEVAIHVASTFVSADADRDLDGTAVIIRDGSGREQSRPLIGSDFIRKSVPMVVLVNDGSASASEIVTGALKDYGVATVIGQRTFGKGKVQTLFPLDDRSALRLTTQLYYPPKHGDINFKRDDDGNKIEGTGGILPDIEVAQSPKWNKEDFKDKANDLQLRTALVFLRARLHGMDVAQATQALRQTP